MKYLIERGAKVDATNNDGNTPLHAASFLCRSEIVQLLLEKGGSVVTKNKKGETPVDVVSTPWSDQLAGFYTELGNGLDLKPDLRRLEQERRQIAGLLRKHAPKAK